MKLKQTVGKVIAKIPPANRYLESLPYRRLLKSNKDAVLLINTPTHRNSGDQAINIAEKHMLQSNSIPYLEISDRDLGVLDNYGQLGVMNKRVILIRGGGYLGTLWMSEEERVRRIIQSNRKGKIIFLPNTIYYGDSLADRKELEKSQKIYNKHKDLNIYVREMISYEFAKKYFFNVRVCPDMVLSLKKDENQGPRNGCLLCLRHDKERTRTDEQEQQLIKNVEALFGSEYSMTDMYADETLSVENREMILEEKFNQFKKAQLVVTDRLHGMIFCAITGTPCIVIDSKSPKVRGCYEWIKHLEYVKFADSVDEIERRYKEIPQKEFHYDNGEIIHYYDDLAKHIKKGMEGKSLWQR